MAIKTGKNWYALYTRSRGEKKVFAALEELGIEAYLPLKKEWRKWSDRSKLVESPLINSYIFVRISAKQYFQVLNIPAAVRYIFFEGVAAAIPDWQIEALRQTLDNQMEYNIVSTPFKKGDRIEILDGPLLGFYGEITDPSAPNKLLIRIDHIGYSMEVKVSREHCAVNVE